MKKICLIICILLLAITAISCAESGHRVVSYKDYNFYVEVVQTAEERAKGLMFRDSLDEKEGMLFIFENEERHSFWMKNTLIPLDIIWMNKDREVVFIVKNIQPCKKDPCPHVTPDKKAKYALELNSGTADKIGLKIGNKLQF